MPATHLSLEELTPEALEDLPDAKRAHLKACPKCRIEARLLAQMDASPPEDLPGLPLARRALILTRSTLLQSFTSAHLADESGEGMGTLEDPAPVLGQLPERHYEGIAPLGLGGMGEVWRVQDLRLQRPVAMKWLRGYRMDNTPILDRFLQEARLTAQLQHPGIVSVHEMGQLPDGRPYFTMEEVRGRTLQSLIEDLHEDSREGQWGQTPEGYGLRRLVAAFHRASEAIAYAHSEGVIHRDLKPNNIMIGAYGEVQVLDWGLAKILPGAEGDVSPVEPLPQATATLGGISGSGAPDQTSQGSIVGTVAYMPPEQAAGEVASLGPTADVYALGATLYHLLAGRRPFEGKTTEVLGLLKDGPPEDVEAAAAAGGVPPIPQGLADLCRTAMARDPAHRYPSAEALAHALGSWLDGARRREEALALVAEADALKAELGGMEHQMDALKGRIRALQRPLAPNAPIAAKRPLWALEDQARALSRAQAALRTRFVERLRAALLRDPELPEAHRRLAAHVQAAHAHAEAAGDWPEAEGLAILLREHGGRDYDAYLSGEGTLSLATTPPGATVQIAPLVEVDRRLLPGPATPLGETPLRDVPLPMGAYILTLQHPDAEPLTYPVWIPRQGRWDGAHSEASAPLALPPRGSLGPHEVYIPPGPFLCGGDPHAPNPFPAATVWVDGFTMTRDPITNHEYLAFLNALVDDGRGEEALRHAPRERGGAEGAEGALIYRRAAGGHFALGTDGDGDAWQGEWPVILIPHGGATAYAAWLHQTTGKPWRLPHELEWEKAARGVDGRPFPWGHDFEVCYAAMRLNPPGRRGPSPVDAHPEDISPYGVRGMAGNVGDWCANTYDPEARPPAFCPREQVEGDAFAPRAKRGGGWPHDAPLLRAAERHGFLPGYRSGFVGFRVVRSWP